MSDTGFGFGSGYGSGSSYLCLPASLPPPSACCVQRVCYAKKFVPPPRPRPRLLPACFHVSRWSTKSFLHRIFTWNF